VTGGIVSPYDLEKGRLIFRHKDECAGSPSRPPQRHQFRRRRKPRASLLASRGIGLQ
jgi:hypothetical protein